MNMNYFRSTTSTSTGKRRRRVKILYVLDDEQQHGREKLQK